MFIFVPSIRLQRGLAGALLVCLTGGQVAAQTASPWIDDTHSSVRLIAGTPHDGALTGGIAFRIQSGWKTYWRTPGDSGVPPRFDFSASDNVEKVTVLWPAPMKFPDGSGGTSFGYQKLFTLPLRIVAKRPDRLVILRTEINYAVCEKLCVPVEAKAELSFSGNASLTASAENPSQDPSIIAALSAIPQTSTIGASNALSIRTVRREGNIVFVDVAAPNAEDVDLFAEGPTPDWALPAPKLLERTPAGLQRFSFDLDGMPSGARPEGAKLKLTLAGGGHAYEVDATLN
jgi:DsbC/DsbD-like thiol-disulfide interchange protein